MFKYNPSCELWFAWDSDFLTKRPSVNFDYIKSTIYG